MKCYACNAASAGKTKHNGEIKPACKRHADPSLKGKRAFAHISTSPTACIYCGTDTRKGSYNHDGQYSHVTCFNRENE